MAGPARGHLGSRGERAGRRLRKRIDTQRDHHGEGPGADDQARGARRDATRYDGLDSGLGVRRSQALRGHGCRGRLTGARTRPGNGRGPARCRSAKNYYGEGITVVGDRIWELTWQNKVAVEWDKNTMTRCARSRSTARAGAVRRRGSAGPQRRVRPAVLPRSGDVRRDGFGCGHARRRPAEKPQ